MKKVKQITESIFIKKYIYFTFFRPHLAFFSNLLSTCTFKVSGIILFSVSLAWTNSAWTCIATLYLYSKVFSQAIHAFRSPSIYRIKRFYSLLKWFSEKHVRFTTVPFEHFSEQGWRRTYYFSNAKYWNSVYKYTIKEDNFKIKTFVLFFVKFWKIKLLLFKFMDNDKFPIWIWNF